MKSEHRCNYKQIFSYSGIITKLFYIEDPNKIVDLPNLIRDIRIARNFKMTPL